MSAYKVKVKWGKETYPDIEVNTEEPPMLFKAQLFALTGVQPERQKVMLKGVTLKDTDWDNFKLRDGVTILLMGSKEEDVPKEPVEKTMFVEDMNETELATALDLPPGLHNINNTCYMNATVQCLRTVPELREALKSFKGVCNPNTASVILWVRSAFGSVARSTLRHFSIAPELTPLRLELVRAYHSELTHLLPPAPIGATCPLELYAADSDRSQSYNALLLEHFQRGTQYVQRENESLTAQSITAALRDLYTNMDQGFTIPPFTLLQMLHIAFPRFAETSEHGGFQQQDANECWTELVRVLQQKLPANQVTETSQAEKYKSLVDQYFGGTFDVEWKCVEAEDEPSTKTKEQFLQLSCFISQDVRYMNSGLRSKMQEQITKMSQSLQRDAVYTKTSKIHRLPAYLTVQFVRFYFKEKEAINAKILKDVKFPFDFDAYELCSPELQEKLAPMRTKFKELEDAQVEAAAKGKTKSKGDGKTKEKGKVVPYWFEEDLGSNNSGYYTLQAVLTHKGRSSSSGHYVGWIRQSEDNWFKCDDDTVSPVSAEDILKLSGGGDWHCAYVLLYGPRILELPVESPEDQ